MKKLVAFLVALLMLLALLAGCAGELLDTNKKQRKTKLKDEIKFSSCFSEDVALVVCGSEEWTGYIINKEGEVVSNLDFEIVNPGAVTDCQFYNGYVFISGGICNLNGEITYPEDVGATAFYQVALEGGYIIAEVTEATFESTQKSLGIMNMNFEWIVEPSQEMFNSLASRFGDVKCLDTSSYYHDGYIYVNSKDDVFVNLNTGEVIPSSNAPFEHPSNSWIWGGDHKFRNYDDEVKVNLSRYDNIRYCSSFEDGVACVIFRNESADTTFFTLINEHGRFLFEPVDFEDYAEKISTDGQNIIVSGTRYGEIMNTQIIKSYDMNGNILAEFNTDSLEEGWHYTISFADGVVLVSSWQQYYYNPKFEPLF